jgi:UDP-N-acetylmuramoyl-tripeptide--D-alanyl-D-alanine ligase
VELRAAEIADAVGGRLEGPDVVVEGATQDSREVRPGHLFVPVVAERDGHDFIPAALEAGAAAYLTSRPSVGGTAVVVDDTVTALGRAGRLARDRLTGDVVGITGSVGKTSVKDLLAAAAGPSRTVAASARSFNNELGVPLTLLGAAGSADLVVVEMGARGPGHIAELCEVAAPTVGVITRVAAVHTETFGSLDGVARTKGELVEALPSSGAAVLNADDERVAAMAERTEARVIRYGVDADASTLQLTAAGVSVDDDLRPTFRLEGDWGTAEVRLSVRGAHMVPNALAAAAAALACGVPLDAVAEGLATAHLSDWRMDLVRLPSGARLLNDAYNANPTSVRAALEALAAVPARRRIAVLGVMAELGPASDAEHAAVTEVAASLGIEVLAVGCDAYGAPSVREVEDAAAALGDLGEGDAVLAKASRVAGLERLAVLLGAPG